MALCKIGFVAAENGNFPIVFSEGLAYQILRKYVQQKA